MERKQVTHEDIERRLVAEHIKPYYDWIRHVVQLSTGSLAVLVSLQEQYVPKSPTWPWLLAVCWGLLLVSILAGLVALLGEHRVPLEAAQNLRLRRHVYGDAATAEALMNDASFTPKPIYGRARNIMFGCLVVGMGALAVFAIMNLGGR